MYILHEELFKFNVLFSVTRMKSNNNFIFFKNCPTIIANFCASLCSTYNDKSPKLRKAVLIFISGSNSLYKILMSSPKTLFKVVMEGCYVVSLANIKLLIPKFNKPIRSLLIFKFY